MAHMHKNAAMRKESHVNQTFPLQRTPIEELHKSRLLVCSCYCCCRCWLCARMNPFLSDESSGLLVFRFAQTHTHTCSDIVSLHLIWSIQIAWPTTFWKPAFLRQFLVNRCRLKYSKRITVPWQSLIERCVEQASFVIAAELLWTMSKSASSNWRVEGKK